MMTSVQYSQAVSSLQANPCKADAAHMQEDLKTFLTDPDTRVTLTKIKIQTNATACQKLFYTHLGRFGAAEAARHYWASWGTTGPELCRLLSAPGLLGLAPALLLLPGGRALCPSHSQLQRTCHQACNKWLLLCQATDHQALPCLVSQSDGSVCMGD